MVTFGSDLYRNPVETKFTSVVVLLADTMSRKNSVNLGRWYDAAVISVKMKWTENYLCSFTYRAHSRSICCCGILFDPKVLVPKGCLVLMPVDVNSASWCRILSPDFQWALNFGKAGWVILLSSENCRLRGAARSSLQTSRSRIFTPRL